MENQPPLDITAAALMFAFLALSAGVIILCAVIVLAGALVLYILFNRLLFAYWPRYRRWIARHEARQIVRSLIDSRKQPELEKFIDLVEQELVKSGRLPWCCCWQKSFKVGEVVHVAGVEGVIVKETAVKVEKIGNKKMKTRR